MMFEFERRMLPRGRIHFTHSESICDCRTWFVVNIQAAEKRWLRNSTFILKTKFHMLLPSLINAALMHEDEHAKFSDDTHQYLLLPLTYWGVGSLDGHVRSMCRARSWNMFCHIVMQHIPCVLHNTILSPWETYSMNFCTTLYRYILLGCGLAQIAPPSPPTLGDNLT